MIRRPPRSTRTATLFPYSTLFRSAVNLLRTHGPALLVALRLREWRPIESAPKDGSLFLGWVAAERWSAEDGGGSGRSADTSEVDFCQRSEEHTSELQSLMRISYAGFCLKKK